MTIGIIATPALAEPRTGVEEYTYQLIKHLAMLEESRKHRFLLYLQHNKKFDFNLPNNFEIKVLKWPGPMWTQLRFSAEMLLRQPDVLFAPLGVLPLVVPRNTVATLHGLEYEFYPKTYSWFNLKYLRRNSKHSLKKSRKIIAISENTKNDLVELYNVRLDKITVVHHGVDRSNYWNDSARNDHNQTPFILYLGRVETKKNIKGLIRAFSLLKEKYQVPHKLVLAGGKGYGFDEVLKSNFSNKQIVFTGYISEQEKWQLLKNADCFAFPSFYEGFGIPILEAQQAGCPVLTSNISSMPEVAGAGAVLVNPDNIEEIAAAMYKIISDEDSKNNLIRKGYQNVDRFSWQKCAQKTLQVILE